MQVEKSPRVVPLGLFSAGGFLPMKSETATYQAAKYGSITQLVRTPLELR